MSGNIMGFDCNGFLGTWPFRRFYHGGLDGLKAVHEKANITGGWVSSLNSIFYNDPMEAEELLAEELKNTPYRQVMGVNPMLPAAVSSVKEAMERFNICAVRLYPGYHRYRLDDLKLAPFFAEIEKLHIPVLVTMRLEDERLNYLITPRIITKEEKEALPKSYPGVRFIYTGMQTYEVTEIAEAFRENNNLYAETSFFKSPCTAFEDVLKAVPEEKILYGSGYPLNCLQSTWIALQKAYIPQEDKQKILYSNIEALTSK